MKEITLPEMTSLDSISLQLPNGLYSTFRTYLENTRVIGLQEHISRLYDPAIEMGITPIVNVGKLREYIRLALNQFSVETRVRMCMTYDGDIYLEMEPLKRLPDKIYQQGVSVITADYQRQNPRLKSTEFIHSSDELRKRIEKRGIFEALLVKNNRVLEGITSNFFYVLNGNLGTARKDVLLGVTRNSVLTVARKGGFEITYRALQLEQVLNLDEAFLTSSSREIVPIVQIDNYQIGQGVPGKVTHFLLASYKEYVRDVAEQI